MEEEATEKQIKFMKNLHIDIPEGCTKQIARLMIQAKLDEPNGDEKPEVQKIKGVTRAPMHPDQEAQRTQSTRKDNGFHLTPENCRAEALKSAIEEFKGESKSEEGFWEVVKRFEKYIVTGE